MHLDTWAGHRGRAAQLRNADQKQELPAIRLLPLVLLSGYSSSDVSPLTSAELVYVRRCCKSGCIGVLCLGYRLVELSRVSGSRYRGDGVVGFCRTASANGPVSLRQNEGAEYGMGTAGICSGAHDTHYVSNVIREPLVQRAVAP